MNTNAWVERAACRGEDPEMWFPTGTRDLSGVQTRYAKAVCRVCPVRRECLNDALVNGIRYGIWGGRTEGEREKLARRRTRRTAA